MADIKLRIEHLQLDHDNPRITHSEGQQQALQKVVNDQQTKLIRLAESIADRGLSPIDKLMVWQVSAKPKRYIALEGNRRVAALILLSNPAAMTGLTMPDALKRTMERLASNFDKSKIEPIACYEVESREDGRYWIALRHNGEDEGRGVVGWKPIVAARFRNRGPDIQAFDMVMDHGGFSEGEAEAIRSGFTLSTLKRFTDSPDVRALLGLNVKEGRLLTDIPAAEAIKPLKKIVLDIANKRVDSRTANNKTSMLNYVRSFDEADKPDLSKKVPERPVEGIEKGEFAKPAKAGSTRRRPRPSERTQIVPKNCRLNVTNNRIDEIYQELTRLPLEGARNAIAVLLRVFLELSVDHFLETHGRSLSLTLPHGKQKWKDLDKKLAEAVDLLVSMNVPREHLAPIIRSQSVRTSPMHTEVLHLYVHNRFATPSPGDLTAAWDQAQPLFEKIWP